MPDKNVKEILVAGAGTMGSGVSYELLKFGYDVVLYDHQVGALEGTRLQHEKMHRSEKMFGRSSLSQPKGELHMTTDLKDVRDVDLVIESIVEKESIKKDLYSVLSGICREEVIFIANSSTVSVEKISTWTNRPDKVVGVHFMNPVERISAVEVIYTRKTSAETTMLIEEFLKTIDKKGILIKDSVGYISNRVLMVAVNQAIQLIEEGVADASTVDEVFKSCMGHTMGPIETSDLIGLDVVRDSLINLHNHFEEGQYKPCELLNEMVSKNLLGKKNGRGFYQYTVD